MPNDLPMSDFIPFILVSGLVSFVATPMMRRVAHTTGFVSAPASDRTKAPPTPMLGGLAIYIGLIAAIILGTPRGAVDEMVGVVIGMTIVSAVGLIDDRYGTPAWLRLLAEAAAGGVLVWAGISVSLFRVEIFNIALTIFWVVAICNAINLLDNMDGLAAGVAVVASLMFFVLAVVENLTLVAVISAGVLGAAVGFLYYNFNPASLFMGDTGALLLGFMLAVMGIKLEFVGRPNAVTWLIPIIILGMPIFDTTLVTLSRLRRGRPVYMGGKDHTSHRLVSALGMSHARAVMTLYLVAVSLGMMAIMLRDATPYQARLILIALIVIFVGGLIWMEIKFAEAQAEEAPTPVIEEPTDVRPPRA